MGTLREDLQRRNGHPHAITYAAIDMGLAYQSGVRENCRDAEIVFDKFHVMKLIGERVDDVRKAESAHGKTEAKKQLKKTLWLWRKNPENLSDLNRLVLTALTTTICGRQRHIKCVWHSKKSTIPSRIRVGQSADSRAGAIGQPSLRQSTLLDHEAHAESCRDDTKTYRWHPRILGFKLTTAYLEGLNSVFRG